MADCGRSGSRFLSLLTGILRTCAESAGEVRGNAEFAAVTGRKVFEFYAHKRPVNGRDQHTAGRLARRDHPEIILARLPFGFGTETAEFIPSLVHVFLLARFKIRE